MDTAERLLARFVALAYAAEHPDLFTPGTDEPPGGAEFVLFCGTISGTNCLNDRSGAT